MIRASASRIVRAGETKLGDPRAFMNNISIYAEIDTVGRSELDGLLNEMAKLLTLVHFYGQRYGSRKSEDCNSFLKIIQNE